MKNFERRLAVLWILLCASALEARETWREIRSPNFVLISNAREGSAQAVVSRMEQFRHALARVLPNQRLMSDVPTQVYAFRDFDSFESFLPRTEEGVTPAAGYFREGPYKNVIALDLSSGRAAYERVVFHEYTHLLLSLGVQDYPLWFEEGMAEFYAATRLAPDGADLGVAEARHRRVLAEHALLPLSELLVADEDWPFSASPLDGALFYAQSWAFVHYLVASRGTDGHERLAAYMTALARGGDRLESFRLVFGKTPEEMEDELRAYIEMGDFRELHYELSERDWSQGFSARILTPPEVQHRWAELFLFTGRPKEARVCLEEANRLDPDLSAAWETRGIADLMEGQTEDAVRNLRRVVDRGEASPMGLYQYARALLHDHSGHGVKSLPSGIAAEAELALTRSLDMKPKQSETARLLAFVYLVRGTRLDEATELVESALGMTPGRPSLLYLYGQLLARRGDYDGAREALGRVRKDAPEESLRDAASELLSRMEDAQRGPGN